ncbi:MAG: M20/M25/M40 family metallo-hydrolase [Planctomycetota bacterium]|jgi:hypothetical protein
MLKRNKSVALFLAVFGAVLVAGYGFAAPVGITPDSFFSHIRFLADPKLEGRFPGTEGCRKAGDYIRDQLQNYGVEPLGENGSFFQKLEYEAYGRKFESRNVAGIIRGSGEKLKDEAILLIAHYDHVGKRTSRGGGDNSAVIYPGADDNASGVAGLLEAARIIKARDLKPKRSIIFLSVSAEECGLIGSRYYAVHPLFPLEKTQVVINLDMIGAYKLALTIIGQQMSPQFKSALDAACKGEDLRVVRLKYGGRSDNRVFENRFIPNMFFWSGKIGDYHTPRDTMETINREKGAAIARIVMKAIVHLADADEIESKMLKPRGTPMPFLGIACSERMKKVKVLCVWDHSPAVHKLRSLDVISAIGDEKISSLEDYYNALGKLKPGDKVAFSIVREEKEIDLELTIGDW